LVFPVSLERLTYGPTNPPPSGRPHPILRPGAQTGRDGIILDILNYPDHLVFISNPVIERFVLPEYPAARIVQAVEWVRLSSLTGASQLHPGESSLLSCWCG
jgi:hypothetical protein